MEKSQESRAKGFHTRTSAGGRPGLFCTGVRGKESEWPCRAGAGTTAALLAGLALPPAPGKDSFLQTPRSLPGEGGGGGEGGRVSTRADLESRPEESLHAFTPTLMAVWETQVSAGEGVEKLDPSHFAGGEAKWFSCCGKWLRGSSRTYKRRIPMGSGNSRLYTQKSEKLVLKKSTGLPWGRSG